MSDQFNSPVCFQTHLGQLPTLGCNETAADLQQVRLVLRDVINSECEDKITICVLMQVSMVTSRLSHYQSCARKLQPYSSDDFCQAVLLNNDLLTHLVSLRRLIGSFDQTNVQGLRGKHPSSDWLVSLPLTLCVFSGVE